MFKTSNGLYLCGMKKPANPIKTKEKTSDEPGTEQKIKNAARSVFYKKGFAATRTRDIAEEAGINLALLNYYFRSKQKLFDIIMVETMQGFTKSLLDIFNDHSTTLDAKIEIFAERHIELLLKNPAVPIFMLSEMRSSPETLFKKIGNVELILQSHFISQIKKGIKEGKIAPIHPLQFVMNMISMTAFPFVAKPLIKSIGQLPENVFTSLMQERQKMIPIWIKAILKAK